LPVFVDIPQFRNYEYSLFTAIRANLMNQQVTRCYSCTERKKEEEGKEVRKEGSKKGKYECS
jgi:hypothetical protein